MMGNTPGNKGPTNGVGGGGVGWSVGLGVEGEDDLEAGVAG
ncbi:MAG: hypothetical protein QOH50_3399 [Kribbellaceae bacterium]|nr:hypothetical protein [Kribbellaceae bacterium]